MSSRGFELFYDGAWQEVTAYEKEGWRYKSGPSDLTGPDPGSLEFTLANDDLEMDPSNPLSSLYGKIGPNTNARMLMYTEAAVSISDDFARTSASTWGNATSGQAWTTSGGSASDYSVSSGLGRMSLGSINTSRRATLAGAVSSGEIAVRVTIPVDPTGDDIETTIMFHYQDGSNYLQASIYWDRDGRPIELRFVRRLAGVASDLAVGYLTMSPVGASLSCDMRLRWFGKDMNLKVWPAADPEPSVWHLSARSSQWTSGQRGLRANLQPLFAGGTPQVVTWDNFSYSAYAATAVAAGEISSWRPDTSVEHVPGVKGRSWTDITADDLLRRIGKADDPDLSPLRRQISTYPSLLGYWPMEEGKDAKNFTNLAASQYPGSYTAGLVELGGNDGPAGGFGAPVVELGSTLSGRFTFDATTNGYQLSFCAKLDAVPGSGTYIAMFQWSDTMQRTWYWRINNGAYEVAVYDQYSTLLGSTTATFGAGVDVTDWIRYRIRVSVSGSTVTYEPAWYGQDTINTYGTSGTFVNVSVGYPIGWEIVANSYTAKGSFSHVFGISDTALDLINTADTRDPFNAFNGEKSWIRFVRLMTESGYGYLIEGNTDTSAVMGRQGRSRLSELLEEIQVTEAGIIYGDPSRVRLIFRLNDSLVNQTPILALTKGVDVGYPLKKIIDDQGAANDITVKNWDTTQVRVTQASGPRSVQEPPAGAGRYPGTLDVSFQWAESLESRGQWELANNTLDRPRYPSVVVDLLAHPELAATADVVRPGDVISLDEVEPATVYLLVTQLSRGGGEIIDTLTMTCLPADIYMTGVYNDGYLYDSSSTTLAEDLDTTETGLDIFSSDPMDTWTSAAVGAQIYVGSELMTISAVSAGSASANGWAQTLTATRAVNGVAVAHTTGDEVHVANPARYVMKNREPN